MKIALQLILSLLLANALPAAACSYPSFTPEQKFRVNSVVVLAAPISVANSPTNALSKTFNGRFSQTIQWQVLVAWKGRYKVGDVFTTITQHETGGMCGDGAQHGREIKLLYLNGREPFNDFSDGNPALSIRELKYLGKRKGGS